MIRIAFKNFNVTCVMQDMSGVTLAATSRNALLDNLVPRAFLLKVGGAGKDPGIGWSRVHLTP